MSLWQQPLALSSFWRHTPWPTPMHHLKKTMSPQTESSTSLAPSYEKRTQAAWLSQNQNSSWNCNLFLLSSTAPWRRLLSVWLDARCFCSQVRYLFEWGLEVHEVAEIVVHLLSLQSSISGEGLPPTLSLGVGSAASAKFHVLLLDDSFPAAAWQVEAVSKSHPEGLQPILGGLCWQKTPCPRDISSQTTWDAWHQQQPLHHCPTTWRTPRAQLRT